ncbi:MAG: UbiA family prenyltransferase [Nitrososphaerota archaeon]|nr:UbiA family prenyltransferase [Nitrososphaerota archaeon]MDG6939327.1 UbiA family prenyltransferase [Nitrososphaerota archaeon]
MKALQFARLIRPPNCVMIGFAVLVGEAVAASTVYATQRSLFGFLTGFCICAYSMVLNDVLDEAVDRANGLDRPIVTGAVSPAQAARFAAALLALGLLFSAFTGPYTFAVAAAFAALATAYNWRLKERGLPGNVAVALSMTIPFIYGGMVAGRPLGVLLDSMSLTAFLSGVGREVVKGMSDVEGDALRDARTVARSHGPRTAARLGASFFLLAVLTSLFPVLAGLAGAAYYAVIGATDALFLYLAARITVDAGSSVAVKKWALFGMLLGLIGYILQGLIGT